ncbi:hypothetical protein P154DRAFT_546429 [Amniculicola lignicola CBS 123094]|uniref:Protein kinase domain-containing protein n=1 Tax=Amniculicola lignicola CBS 123094 TaxID=1392246 RepID=A0A6A5WDS9_9PLEO|nr:hypothetical protein P154DRAFT_546429 [Amniculicola lignicola CBS 123094]
MDGYEYVNAAYISGDERQYVYKGIDRLIYFLHDTKVLEQELQNLELLYGNKQIVQLVAAVTSSSLYQTREYGAPSVLRGILLEYHPNALAYMHQMGVTHIDLKPKNVVMSREWKAIIIDVSGIGGTTDEFLLPELFEALDRCLEKWGLRVQSDTWALGKILALMAEAMNNSGKDKLALPNIAPLSNHSHSYSTIG